MGFVGEGAGDVGGVPGVGVVGPVGVGGVGGALGLRPGVLGAVIRSSGKGGRVTLIVTVPE